MCLGEDHFIFLTLMPFVISLTHIYIYMLVLLYLQVKLSILISILVGVTANLLCDCLERVQVSASYIIAGSYIAT